MTLAVGAKYWVAADMAVSPLNGPAMRCPYNGHVWADFTWTGTPTGTLALQFRTAGGPWLEVPGSAAAFTVQPAGAPGGPLACNWVNVPGTEFRVVYAGAGGGTITANVGFGDVQEASW
jgi:hypothetical protein